MRAGDRRQNVAKPEAITLNFIARYDGKFPVEHWPCIYKGVKLAIFTAGINGCGEVIEKRLVKIASNESRRELSGINTGKPGAKTGSDHLSREFIGGMFPNWEDWFQACAL